jgi:hypothetical protein
MPAARLDMLTGRLDMPAPAPLRLFLHFTGTL